MMDPVWLLVLLPIAAASGWIAAIASRFQWPMRNPVPTVYLQGINYLLNDQHDKALELFFGGLDVDSKTIEIHLTLGNLYRQRGEIGRATLIHKKLVERSDLTGEQRSQAFFELGHDYYAAGILDRAEQVFKELMQGGRYQEQAHDLLREIYEQEREWDNCINITNSLTRISSRDYSPLLAQYHCERAEEAIREGRYSKAEEYVKAAMDTEGDCVRAILQSGRIKAIRGDHTAAIEIWRSIESNSPRYIPETVSLVTESYQSLQRPRELANFLRSTAESEEDAQLAVAYIDILESLNEKQQAEEYLTKWIRKYPSLHCLHRLILLKLKDSISSVPDDFELIQSMIRKEIDPSRRYQCQRCGYTVKTLHWQCPSCRGWNSFLSQRSSQTTVDSKAIKAEI